MAQWTAVGVYFPFVRNHNTKGTIPQEPWAFSPKELDVCRTAINRRYRLMPYIYTLFREASQSGMPVMRPLLMADPRDPALRAEEQAFLLGGDLMVRPRWAETSLLGSWPSFSLEAADDGYQCELRQRPGSVIPLANLAQSTAQMHTDSLTLLVSLDGEGRATGRLYEDEGDGFGYRCGAYRDTRLEAVLTGKELRVALRQEGGKLPLSQMRTLRVGLVAGGKVTYSSWQQGNDISFKIK